MPRGELLPTRRLLLRVYRRLRARYGHAGWWPGESSFEVCVGAILVQNTAWANVERTLASLRHRGLLSFEALHRCRPSRLAPLLRSSGTFRVKARRLRAFLDFLGSEYGGRVEAMAAEDPAVLRQKLLAVAGIGPETADSIALYAAGHPVFVVDAYARRVFSRLGLLPGEDRAGRARPTSSVPEAYDQVQRFLTDRLPRDAALYNDYHAQLVRLGKEACRTRPRCAACPLDDLCPKRGLLSTRSFAPSSESFVRVACCHPEELRSSRATKDPQSHMPSWRAMLKALPALLLLLSLATPSTAQDFWAHWGDGKAELNGYALKQPRYGTVRTGTSVLIFVTEDFSDALRVKADPGKHPASDVYPVLKLNAVRDFSTGIYDYNVMTSAFLRIAPGWPVAKVSFSSQEWCGHVWHQIVPRDGKLGGIFHSYFDGEADGADALAFPKDGVFEDALPVLLRGWNGEYLKPGESRTVPFLPSLFWARLNHKPLAWTKATIARAATTRAVTVPAGRFDVTAYSVETADGRTLSFQIESGSPHRLIRQTGPDGEELALKGSTRLPYWQLNAPGGEQHLKELGLR